MIRHNLHAIKQHRNLGHSTRGEVFQRFRSHFSASFASLPLTFVFSHCRFRRPSIVHPCKASRVRFTRLLSGAPEPRR
jgi:hypothetical protein